MTDLLRGTAHATAIEKLADDPRAYKQMSVAARKQAGQFSWKSVAEKYSNLYDRVLKTTAIS